MRTIILLIISISLYNCGTASYTSSNHFDCKQSSDFKADTDRKQLIYMILNRAVVENKDIADYQLIKDKKKIYILDRYYSAFTGPTRPKSYLLDSNNIPNQIEDVKFCLKSKNELQKIADETIPFTYLTFANIKINENTATIGISNGWQAQTNGNIAYLSGGGYVWQFKKVEGTWEFDKILSNFQS